MHRRPTSNLSKSVGTGVAEADIEHFNATCKKANVAKHASWLPHSCASERSLSMCGAQWQHRLFRSPLSEGGTRGSAVPMRWQIAACQAAAHFCLQS
eukprot:UN3089